MRRANHKSRCSFFKRHSGLLMSAALVASACQGFCMLGGGVSSGIKYGFVPGTGGGRVTQKACPGQGQGQGQGQGRAQPQPGDAREPSEHGLLDSVAEACTNAFHWMTGGGKVTAEDVQQAQTEVEQKGGRIVSNSGAASLINAVGCDLSQWDKLVDSLAMLLGLEEKSKMALWCSQFIDQFEGEHIWDTQEGGVRTTAYAAFCTVRDEPGQKMHVTYGQHNLSMAVMESAMDGSAFPPSNCVNYRGRTFTVLPQASPHTPDCGQDMKGKCFGIPARWRVWDLSADGQAAEVIQHVIKPYTWNVDEIIVKAGQEFPRWRTAHSDDHIAGTKVSDNCSFLAYNPSQQSYCFSDTGRLLIEKVPGTSFELQQEWLRYVKLSAQAEWSSRLGLRLGTASPGEGS